MASFPAWVRTLFNNRVEGPSFRTLSLTPSKDDGSLEDDHNDFALAVYERLRSGHRNLFFSPFSIRIALAMSYAGANGETAAR